MVCTRSLTSHGFNTGTYLDTVCMSCIWHLWYIPWGHRICITSAQAVRAPVRLTAQSVISDCKIEVPTLVYQQFPLPVLVVHVFFHADLAWSILCLAVSDTAYLMLCPFQGTDQVISWTRKPNRFSRSCLLDKTTGGTWLFSLTLCRLNSVIE